MKSYAIAILLLAYVHSQCTDGCLSCTDNNECRVCDVTNGYYLAKTTCLLSSEKNCQIFDLSGNCLFCKHGYFTDPNAEQCISIIDNGELDSNCQRFNLERQCVQCRENHFLLGSTCIEISDTEKITGCVMYNTKSECVECTSGKTLNLQGTQCLDNSDIDQCLEQTTVKCNDCKVGYTLNPNFFLLSIQIAMESTYQNSVYQKIENFFKKNYFFEEGCLKNQGENCLVYSDFNQCMQCVSEHYLQNGKCYAFPKEQIENCKIYLNQLNCKECQQGYILTGTKTCKKIENNQLINNCVLYNPKSQNIECQKCKTNYFVNKSLSCQARLKNISNCKILSFDSDTCQTCQDSYQVTDDGLKCLFKIDNCLTYKDTSNSSDVTQHICEVCNSGLYFNELQRTCEQGQVDNCKYYNKDPNKCVTCQHEYYLENDLCAKHDKILDCKVYSNTNENQCDECLDTSILMNQTNTCDLVSIQGCEIFDSTSSCQVCKDGYDLTNNLCTLINSDLNCKRSENGVCNICQDQYFLLNNVCYLPFEYERLYCLTNKNDGTSNTHINSQCNICDDYSIPFNQKNHNVCISVDELSLISQNQKIANCQRYQIKNGEIKCKQCEKTFILSDDESQCDLTCPIDKHYKLNFIFEDDNTYGYQYKNYYYCVAYTGDNVQSVTLDQDFEITSYQLDNTHNYLIDFTKMTNFKIIPPENMNQVTLSTDLYTLPDYKETSIVEPTDDTINGATGFIDSKGNKVEHCEYYFEKHSQYKCSKCQFGYFGKIDFFKIDNCYTYNSSDQKCDLCVHQYKLADDKLSCVLTEIQGCSIYEKNTAKCAVCDDQFYLDKDNNECKKSSIENCKIHDPFKENECMVCNKGYLLNQDNKLCGKLIDNCLINNFNDDKSTMECDQCDLGYFSQTNKTQCVKGTEDVPKCYQFKEDSDECLIYINIMQVTKLNQCLDQRHKCAKFDTDDPSKCIKCYKDNYYLVGGTNQQEGVCCEYFTYPDLTQDKQKECKNEDTGNPHCKIFKINDDEDGYVCDECEQGYFMNPSAKDPVNDDNKYPSTICCPQGQQQDDHATKKCIDKVNVKPEDDNYFKCSVYDLDKELCQLCKDGLYLHKKKCCTIGKYHNGDDDFRTQCSETDIPTNENCNEYDSDNKCQDCKQDYNLDNGICCSNTEFAEATGATTYACKTLTVAIPNCQELKSSSWVGGQTVNVCKICTSDYYLANDDKACCKESNNTDSEIFTTSCQSLSTLSQTSIPNCLIYDTDYKCKKCSTGFPSFNGRICCASQEIYDLDTTHTSLNCRSINFIYENCDNIIEFSNDDKFCKKCKDGFYKINNRCSEHGKYMKNLVDDNAGTEQDTQITDQLIKFGTMKNPSDCIEIEYVSTAIVNPDDGSETINYKCIKCKDGYILNDLYKNGDYSKDPCIEEKYEQGYYDDTLILDSSVKLNTYTQQCLLFDQISNTCQQTEENDIYPFGYCQNYGSYFYYKMIKEQPCCISGQYYDTSEKKCKNITDTNCLLSANDGSTCKLCKDGYFIKDDGCVQYITTIGNCLIAEDDTKCERCEFGYYLTTPANTACTVVPNNTRALDFCKESGDDTACDACHPGYYKSENYCCKLGTYQTADDEECISIPFENCAKYNGNECNECFTFENNYCFNQPDWLLKIQATPYSPIILEKNENYTNYDNFKDYYHSMQKGCCKEGYYWNINNKSCDQISVGNCLRVKDDDQSKCVKCKPNYQVNVADDTCIEITTATTGYYQSNGIYCPEYQYYDAIKKKCLLHPDKKCKKSSNNYSCDECDDNFIQSTFYLKLQISHNAGERDGCFTKLPDILFQPCVQNADQSYPQIPGSNPLAPITNKNDLFDYDKMYYRRKNCNIFEFHSDSNNNNDKQECKTDECEDGYYLINKRCCKNDEYPLNDGCINKQDMHDVCNSYDISTHTCLGCEVGFELQDGFCCKEGSQYDSDLFMCIEKPLNCNKFLTKQNICIECYTGFYMDSNNYCCPHYQYYDNEEQKCLNFNEDGMIGCKKGNKEYCYECSQQTHYYFYDLNISNSYQKTKAKCCQNGFKYDNDLSKCVPLLNNCKEQDAFENCTSCKDGFYLSDIICCPYGYVSDGNGTCELHEPEKYCKKWNYVSGGTHTCNTCNDGYHPFEDNSEINCCPYFYTWHTDDDKCVKIDPPAADKYQRLSSINCKIFNKDTVTHDSTDYHTCDICEDGYYLSQESDNVYFDRGVQSTINRCCPFNMRTQEFDSLVGCEKIKAETEDSQDIVGLPTPETDCIEADYLQVSSLVDGLTTDYDQQIICTRCKEGKVALIDFRDYKAGRQADNDTPGTTISNYVQCVTRTSDHDDRCWAYFVNESDNDKPIRYCLNFDRTKYYLTNMNNDPTSQDNSQLLPCEFGFYYNDDQCKQIQGDLGTLSLKSEFANCQQITGTDQSDFMCSKCADNYFLDPTATSTGDLNFCIGKKQTGGLSDCLFEREVDGGTNLCLICNPGFKLVSNACSASIQDNSQSYYKYCSLVSAEDECNYCSKMEIQGVEYQTYLTNGGCCLESQYFDTDLEVCASDDNCLAVADQNKNQKECLFCNYQKDLFFVGDGNGICCKRGTVIDTSQNINLCHVPTKDHLKQCKYFKSKTECRQLTDIEKKHLTEEDQKPCFQNGSTKYYYHDNACCELGKFSDNDECNDPSGVPQSSCNEFELGSTSNCAKCKDGFYLTNKICCQDGQYLNGSTCDNISTIVSKGVDSLCQQYINGQCLKCSSGEVNNLGCCGDNYRDSSGLCQQSTLSSILYAVGSSLCENGKYLTNNTCCDFGQYYQGNACISTGVTDTSCLIPDPDTPTTCKLCKQGMKFSGKDCQQVGKFYSKLKDKQVEESIILNCINFDNDGKCTQCDSDQNYYISQDMCCPFNTKYDDSTGSCIQIEFQCKQFKKDAEECEVCNDGYYVNPNDNQKCCLYGLKPSDACRQPTLPIDINNCSKFDTDKKCIECKDQYNLYDQFCCPQGKVLLNKGYTEEHCVTIDKLYDNCDHFNPLTLTCEECKDNFYNDNDQSICCAINTHYSLEDNECIPNYKQCQKQKDDECTKCAGDTYISGKDKKKRCCPYYSYFDDDDNECKEIEIDNCKQGKYDKDDNNNDIIICEKCQEASPLTYLTNDHCCLQNQYWSKKYEQCISTIKFCSKYDGTSEEVSCLECSNDLLLLNNKKKCCSRQSFYFSLKDEDNDSDDEDKYQECFSQAPLEYFSWTCTVYDSINLKCTACKKGYYLMNDHCCEEGTYYQSNDTQTCTGSLSTTENCIEGNQSGECTKCKLGFKIKADKSCIEILDNCDEFDEENNKCTTCKQNYFVTPHGYCCLAGQSTSDSDQTTCSADNITIEKCVQLNSSDQTKCETCELGYYVEKSNENFCCQEGHFCTNSSTKVKGNIENCKEYDDDVNACTKCYPDYSLMTIKNDTKYCYPTKFDNCIESKFKDNEGSTDLNPYECNKCAEGFETKQIDPKVSEWLRPQKQERCHVIDIQKKYEDSSMICKYCSHDYYLDASQNNTCQERSEFSKNNCEIRDQNSDKCIRCMKGYYLNQNINDGVTEEDNKKDQCQKNENCLFELENSDGTKPCAQCIDTHTMILKDLNSTTLEDMTSLERDCIITTDLNNLLKKDLEPAFSNPEVMPGIIEKCEKHYQCKDDYLNGLDINLHKYLSCHICIDEDRIPFISLDLKYENDNIKEQGIKMYFYKNPTNEVWSKYNQNRNGKQSQCFKKNLDDFNVQDKDKFPSHCAIGVINASKQSIISQTDNKNASSIDELGIFCVACKPGYKPLFSEDLDYHVYDCQEIQNCEMEGDKKSKSAFNECDYCKENYYHEFTEANGLDKTKCIQSSTHHDPLCYAFDTENNFCKVCINGYQKNYENKCEKLDVPYCEEGQSNFKTSFQKKNYRLAIYRGVEGCKKCKDGYLQLFREQQDDFTCIYSSYAKQNAFREIDQKYLSNCQRYYWADSNLQCSKCNQQFIVTNEQKCVAVNDSHLNCLIAKDTSSCHQCNQNTVLVQGKCLEKSIENCLIYKENEEKLLCSICNDGFYLQNLICNGGLIPNCARYSSKDVCSTCNSGYQLIKNQQNQTLCIQVVSHKNCLEFNSDQFNSMKVTCNQCSPEYYLNQQANDQKICLPLQRADGCLKYDVNNSFSNSSLLCVECQINMYLKDGKCFVRQIKVSNCLETDPQKDACKLCADNFYLSEDQMECIPNPTGVISCAIYDENNVCILCKPSYYLMHQKCFSLPSEQSIPNCEAYNESKECMKCEDLYLLEEKQCVLKNLNNCLVYLNSTNCQVCQNGYGIQVNDGVSTCVLISVVPNCIQYSSTDPFPCQSCENDYYLNVTDNQCVAIEENKKILNCQKYSVNQTCEACETGYILSQDQQKCILLNQQSNCIAHVEQGSPFCIKCNVGYTLNKQYQCVEGSQNQIDNCLVTEMNNSSVCSLCQPGYYMKEDKKCYKTSSNNDDNGNDDNGNDDNGNDDGNNNPNDPNDTDDQDDDTNNSVGNLLWGSITLLMILLI